MVVVMADVVTGVVELPVWLVVVAAGVVVGLVSVKTIVSSSIQAFTHREKVKPPGQSKAVPVGVRAQERKSPKTSLKSHFPDLTYRCMPPSVRL